MKHYLLIKRLGEVSVVSFDDTERKVQYLYGEEVQDMKNLDDFPWGLKNIDKCLWEDYSRDAGMVDCRFYKIHADALKEFVKLGATKVLDYRVEGDEFEEDECHPCKWGGFN